MVTFEDKFYYYGFVLFEKKRNGNPVNPKKTPPSTGVDPVSP